MSVFDGEPTKIPNGGTLFYSDTVLPRSHIIENDIEAKDLFMDANDATGGDNTSDEQDEIPATVKEADSTNGLPI